MCRHVIAFLKSKRGHNGVIPHHHTMIGTKEEVQGRWGRRVEVDGGDLGGGRVRGRVGAIRFYFPQPLAFFGFSPHNFLIRAKMHNLKKVTKGGRHDPILTHPVWGHKAGGPNEGGWCGGFSFGWTLAPRRKLENWIGNGVWILHYYYYLSPNLRKRRWWMAATISGSLLNELKGNSYSAKAISHFLNEKRESPLSWKRPSGR